MKLPPQLRQKGNAYYYDHGGKPRKWEALGSDRARALLRWAEIRGGSATDGTVEWLIDLFLSKKSGLAESTLKSYRNSATIIKKVAGKASVMGLDQGHMNQLIDEYRSKQMARNAALFVKNVYSWAVSRGIIKYSPFTGMRLKNRSQRDRYLNDGELLAIREKLQPKFQVALDLAYLLGLRVSGVVALKLSDIKNGVISFHPKKSKKPITYQVTDEVQAVLDRAKGLPGNVRGLTIICNRDGQPYNAKTVSGKFKAAAKAAGIENARFHDLRAKSASDEEATAQDRLGHQDGNTTKGYLRKPKVVQPIKGIFVEGSTNTAKKPL